jgi:hypothetical protein
MGRSVASGINLWKTFWCRGRPLTSGGLGRTALGPKSRCIELPRSDRVLDLSLQRRCLGGFNLLARASLIQSLRELVRHCTRCCSHKME